jgi:hypothetical protein
MTAWTRRDAEHHAEREDREYLARMARLRGEPEVVETRKSAWPSASVNVEPDAESGDRRARRVR